MKKAVLDHYLQFSMFTNPGPYKRILKKLPSDIKATGDLVRGQFIHRTTLEAGNTGTNADLRFGDMRKVPWYRQTEDDNFITVPAMVAELLRRNNNGFIKNRPVEDKLVLTCRYTAVLMASILKCEGIPARVRSGNASYFGDGKESGDHWITQYWNKKEKRWITIDVDGSWSFVGDFDPYDIPKGKFDFPADAWINIRAGKDKASRFTNDAPARGLIVVLWSLFYDFHCLMNNEVGYLHRPKFILPANFKKLTEKDFKEIDRLAKLMQDPDENFDKLKKIWNTNQKFRLLSGGVL